MCGLFAGWLASWYLSYSSERKVEKYVVVNGEELILSRVLVKTVLSEHSVLQPENVIAK